MRRRRWHALDRRDRLLLHYNSGLCSSIRWVVYPKINKTYSNFNDFLDSFDLLSTSILMTFWSIFGQNLELNLSPWSFDTNYSALRDFQIGDFLVQFRISFLYQITNSNGSNLDCFSISPTKDKITVMISKLQRHEQDNEEDTKGDQNMQRKVTDFSSTKAAVFQQEEIAKFSLLSYKNHTQTARTRSNIYIGIR